MAEEQSSNQPTAEAQRNRQNNRAELTGFDAMAAHFQEGFLIQNLVAEAVALAKQISNS